MVIRPARLEVGHYDTVTRFDVNRQEGFAKGSGALYVPWRSRTEWSGRTAPPIAMQVLDLPHTKVNESFGLDASGRSSAFHTDVTLGQRLQYADSPENAVFNLIRPSRMAEGAAFNAYRYPFGSAAAFNRAVFYEELVVGMTFNVQGLAGTESASFARPTIRENIHPLYGR